MSTKLGQAHRTLSYDIASPKGLSLAEATRRRIKQAQAEANQQFTWSRRKLALRIFPQDVLHTGLSPIFPEYRWGDGFTRVDGDEWNAAIIVRFLLWVSTVLPNGMFIRLYDTGHYVAPAFVILRQGEFEFDEKSADWQTMLTEISQRLPVHKLKEAREAALQGEWVRPKKAARFVAVCPELQFLKAQMKAGEVAKLTVDDVADRVKFPWDEEQQAAA